MDSRTIIVSGVSVAYVYYKWVSDKFFLFLHGRGRSKEDWSGYFKSLKEKEIGFLAIDFPWFWKSSTPKEHRGVPEYSEFVVNLLDKLDIHIPVSLVAHSFGWRIAFYMAVNYKERVKNLFLMAPGWIEKKHSWFYKILMDMGKKILSPKIMKPVKNKVKGMLWSKDYLESSNMRWIFLKVVNQDLRNLLWSIEQDVYLYRWDWDDQILHWQIDYMVNNIKKIKFHEYHEIWHYVHIDKMEDILFDMFNNDTK